MVIWLIIFATSPLAFVLIVKRSEYLAEVNQCTLEFLQNMMKMAMSKYSRCIQM